MRDVIYMELLKLVPQRHHCTVMSRNQTSGCLRPVLFNESERHVLPVRSACLVTLLIVTNSTTSYPEGAESIKHVGV